MGDMSLRWVPKPIAGLLLLCMKGDIDPKCLLIIPNGAVPGAEHSVLQHWMPAAPLPPWQQVEDTAAVPAAYQEVNYNSIVENH